MAKFALYSTDIDPTVDPASADPAPAILIVLDRDPDTDNYDPNAGTEGRGSIIPTLGGAVRQDFGFFAEDGRIRFSGRDCMSKTKRDALRAISRVVDGEYYFTDGFNCWKVAFARPNGFRSWHNILWALREGIDVYSYEAALNVISVEIEH